MRFGGTPNGGHLCAKFVEVSPRSVERGCDFSRAAGQALHPSKSLGMSRHSDRDLCAKSVCPTG